MKVIKHRFKFTAVLACFSLGLGLIGNATHAEQDEEIAQTKQFVVRCDEGQTVQSFLDRYGAHRKMALDLVGICSGFTITHDDVSIAPLYDEACPGATVNGKIEVDGVRRIGMRCIDIVGLDGGVLVLGGRAFLEDVNIYGSDDIGIEIRDGGALDMFGGSVTNHVEGVSLEAGFAQFEDTDISNNADNGVSVEKNSYFELGGGLITNNGDRGVNVSSSSVLVLDGTTVSNNHSGVGVDDSSTAYIENATIENSTRTGLAVNMNSSVDVVGGTIEGNHWNGIFVARHSMARIQGGAQIINNSRYGIRMILDAGVDLRPGTTVWGNWRGPVLCDGKESSVNFDPSVIMEPISLDDCPDPEF
jgi:hypothetical protein